MRRPPPYSALRADVLPLRYVTDLLRACTAPTCLAGCVLALLPGPVARADAPTARDTAVDMPTISPRPTLIVRLPTGNVNDSPASSALPQPEIP